MDTVKNGVQQPNQRLPFILTTYISRVAQQMLKPGGWPATLVKLTLIPSFPVFVVVPKVYVPALLAG